VIVLLVWPEVTDSAPLVILLVVLLILLGIVIARLIWRS
jgi:hypothetical protein